MLIRVVALAITQLLINVQALSPPLTGTEPPCITSAPAAGSSAQLKTIIEPGQPFRETSSGEVSVASYNILSPTLHSLSQPFEQRKEYELKDRKERVPVALQIAKRLNADVLCLQEVDGGPDHLETLKELLMSPEGANGETCKGYDSFIWSPLHPNRRDDIVGLCVAWRSDKHKVVSKQRFRRGLVVQLEENESGATFSIGNLHLPARPADIYGRLSSVATACRRIEDNRVSSAVSALDGAALLMGDFNCNTDSSPIRLLKNGLVSPGILFERNYRHKLTKNHAYKLRHGLKFLDAYGSSIRKSVAPITVSLHGRGPGSMDHVLYMPGRWGSTRRSKGRLELAREDRVLITALAGGRRKRRRRFAIDRKKTKAETEPTSLLRVEAVLATIDPIDTERTSLITSGLPRLEHGFPSDHLPVGVLLSPFDEEKPETVTHDNVNGDHGDDLMDALNPNSSTKRGDAYAVRQRHNALVRAVTGWLSQRGTIDFIKDEPLYRWKWVEGLAYVKKKMRAPDICCVAPSKSAPPDSVARGTLLMVEVTVSNKPSMARKEKQKKYQDLSLTLQSSPTVRDKELSVPSPFVIVVSDAGGLPLETMRTLDYLAAMTRASEELKDDYGAAILGEELLRIRNHWSPATD